MPLSLSEQTEIIEGRLGPDNSTGANGQFPQVKLIDLVTAEAFKQASTFKTTYKTFDESDPGNASAVSYKEKMFLICDSIFTKSQSILKSMLTVMVTQAAPNVDYSQIDNFTQSAWETFVSNYIYISMEFVAKVNKDERTAYNTLP